MGAKTGKRIGLEISNSAVRMAEVSFSGGRAKLLNLAQVRLPARSVVDGAVLDVTAVASTIERCVKEGGFTGKDVHIGVAGLRAITRELDMPHVPDGELDAAVKLQALDVIPFPVEKTLLSARPLDEVPGADGMLMRRVLIAAAHRDLVDPLVEAVTAAGLVPLSIDLTSTALVRALYDPATSTGGPEAIVSIGSGLTTIVVHESGTPHFVRTIAEGGDTITAAIAGALDLPLDDAESTKRNLDQAGPHIRAAAAAAQNASASLVAEIRSSVEYYSTLPGRSDVRRVTLTGGGSRLAGLAERLQQQVRADVVRGSAFSRVDASSLELSPEDAARRDPLVSAVIGLALPDPPGVKALDLMPEEILAARRRKKFEQTLLVAAGVVLVLLVALGVLRFFQVHNAENNVASQRTEITDLNAQIAQRDKAAKEYAQIQSDEGSVTSALASDVNWPAVLRDLAATMPGGGVVTSIQGSYSAPVAAGTTPSSALPVVGESQAQKEATVVATLDVSVSSNDGFSYFRAWMKTFETSPEFRVVSTSGVTHPSGTTINYTAVLDVLGTIQSSRISEFEVHPK